MAEKRKPSSKIEQDIAAIRSERNVFREISPALLAWLGNECGAWNMHPEVKNPNHLPPNLYTIALFNRLLGKIGILHPFNFQVLAEKLLEASNDDDIALIRRRANAQTKKEERS